MEQISCQYFSVCQWKRSHCPLGHQIKQVHLWVQGQPFIKRWKQKRQYLLEQDNFYPIGCHVRRWEKKRASNLGSQKPKRSSCYFRPRPHQRYQYNGMVSNWPGSYSHRRKRQQDCLLELYSIIGANFNPTTESIDFRSQMVKETPINLLFGLGGQNSNLHHGQRKFVQLRSQMVQSSNWVVFLWKRVIDQVFIKLRSKTYRSQIINTSPNPIFTHSSFIKRAWGCFGRKFLRIKK